MDSEIKRIIIHSKKSRRCNTSVLPKQNLENYIQVNPDYLRYLHGSWVKYVNKETDEYDAGGFITDVTSYRVNIRTPQRQELSDIAISKNKFYVNKDDKNYQSLREFMMTKENLNERVRILAVKEKVIAERTQALIAKEKNLEARKLEFEKLRDTILRNRRGVAEADRIVQQATEVCDAVKMQEEP